MSDSLNEAIISDISLQELFEGVSDTDQIPYEDLLNAKRMYDYLVESANVAKATGKNIDEVLDEGILGGLLGGLTGATIGPSIGKGICKCLGINENGLLGSLLTGRIFLAALGGYLGYKA